MVCRPPFDTPHHVCGRRHGRRRRRFRVSAIPAARRCGVGGGRPGLIDHDPLRCARPAEPLDVAGGIDLYPVVGMSRGDPPDRGPSYPGRRGAGARRRRSRVRRRPAADAPGVVAAPAGWRGRPRRWRSCADGRDRQQGAQGPPAPWSSGGRLGTVRHLHSWGEGCSRKPGNRRCGCMETCTGVVRPERRGQGDAGVLPHVERWPSTQEVCRGIAKTLPKHGHECGERYRTPSRGSEKRFGLLNRLGGRDQR